MRNSKTHFEQVPLEVVPKIPEQQIPDKTQPRNSEPPAEAVKKDPPGTSASREEGQKLIPSFDVFRTGIDSSPVWVGTATTVEDGEARARELMAHSTDEYFILSQQTQTRISITRHGQSTMHNQ